MQNLMTDHSDTNRFDRIKSAALAATASAVTFFGGTPVANAPTSPIIDPHRNNPAETISENGIKTGIVQEQIKTIHNEKRTDDPSIVGIVRDKNGISSFSNLKGDSSKIHDYASVGKMVTIAMMDEMAESNVIDYQKPVLPQYAREFHLKEGITYGDALKATYYYSNNDAAQAMLKSALHEKNHLDDKAHVSNADVAENLTEYMSQNGFRKSFQSNAAGYPEFSDAQSPAYSAPGIPSRSTGYSPGELASFLADKYCDGTGHTISPETSRLLDLNVKQTPFTVPITTKGNTTTAITSRGIQETARTDYADDPTITHRYAKAGHSNDANSGAYIFNYNDHSCRVVLGGGKLANREVDFPRTFNRFAENTDAPKPSTPSRKPGL